MFKAAYMDDIFQILIYLFFFAIYGISQLLKNRRKNNRPTIDQPEGNPNQVPRQDTRPSQPKSFEDVIRELMGDRPVEQERPREEPPVRQQTRNRQSQRKRSREIQSEAYETGSDTYQQAVDEARNMEKLDDRIDLENLDKFIKPAMPATLDGPSKKKKKFINDIRKSLSSPDSAKKAIILSEILNRKYF